MAAFPEPQQRCDGAAGHRGTMSTPRTAECVTMSQHSSGTLVPRCAVVAVVFYRNTTALRKLLEQLPQHTQR